MGGKAEVSTAPQTGGHGTFCLGTTVGLGYSSSWDPVTPLKKWFVITFLPRSNHSVVLVPAIAVFHSPNHYLQSPSTVILEPKKRKPVTTSAFSPSTCHAVMGPDATQQRESAIRRCLAPAPGGQGEADLYLGRFPMPAPQAELRKFSGANSVEKREDNVAEQRKMWKPGSCLQGFHGQRSVADYSP
ncbi:unnamed protein product [Rangifer tarandus platyrhynchus]|uniref:Uncharacterized protein n=2 Tax=Rangifer tarandus platyrhynchus TaxID=3082113 RepID=A0AC59ZRH1_RANTA|nr:unnamed protein product [Rangifer tarandus platyrhynchus]